MRSKHPSHEGLRFVDGELFVCAEVLIMVVSKKFSSLFQPGQIGKVRIRNRIVMSPIGTTFWSDTGEVTERIIDYYAARARGGAGLIIVSFAHPDYPPGYRALASLESEQMVDGNMRLVQKLHPYGAKLITFHLCSWQ